MLLQSNNISRIREYTQGEPTQKVIWSTQTPQISILVQDMRDLISHNSMIYHELLILSLEILCHEFQASYLDQSFFTLLRDHGWCYVSNRFSAMDDYIAQPNIESPSMAIPIHINGSHWVALCRMIKNGRTYILHADDLNCPTTEREICRTLFSPSTSRAFCPTNSIWTRCSNYTYRPHSNECGPRTILSLAIMMSDSAIHQGSLLQYMNPNLAQQSRVWMSHILTSGQVLLLPPTLTAQRQTSSVTTLSSHHSQVLPCQGNTVLRPKVN
jgi:hypothetical protein